MVWGSATTGEMPDGGHARGKGGYFPVSWNGGAELNSVIVSFDSGVTAMLVINGQVSEKTVLMDAYKAAFQ
jgi:hypothetical protein